MNAPPILDDMTDPIRLVCQDPDATHTRFAVMDIDEPIGLDDDGEWTHFLHRDLTWTQGASALAGEQVDRLGWEVPRDVLADVRAHRDRRRQAADLARLPDARNYLEDYRARLAAHPAGFRDDPGAC